MVHEKNFRESITMLVVHEGDSPRRPRSSSADSSDRDSDTDLNAAQHQDLDPALRGEKARYDKESAALLSAVGSTTRTAATTAPRSTAGKSISLNQAKAGRSCRNAGGGKNSALKGLATIKEGTADGAHAGFPRGLRLGRAQELETEALLKQQRHHATLVAARRFLELGEQRGSTGSSSAASRRSSFGPDAHYVLTNDFNNRHGAGAQRGGQAQGGSGNPREFRGLTEQAIKKNTLDKPDFDKLVGGEGFKNRKTDSPEIASATARAMADDNESQNPERTSLGAPFLKRDEAHEKSELQDPHLADQDNSTSYLDAGPNDMGSDGERYSLEYSQTVEADSSGLSEIKYLLGEPIDARAFERRPTNAKVKTAQ